MDSSIWIAMALVGVGTYLMRLLPTLWMARKLARSKNASSIDNLPIWLTVLGPAMIAAMLGVSLIPAVPSFSTWFATVIGCAVTLLVWLRTRSLGLPVGLGVACFGLVVYIGKIVLV